MSPDDFNRLVRRTPEPRRLDAARNPPAIRAVTGLSEIDSGQIASPLTETGRTHYASRNAVSSDGVFTFAWSPIESIAFADANGNPVVLEFAEPAP